MDMKAHVLKPSLEVQFLNDLAQKQNRVSVYLRNGIRLKSNLVAHDADTICIKADAGIQMIYKNGASTIQPEIDFLNYT